MLNRVSVHLLGKKIKLKIQSKQCGESNKNVVYENIEKKSLFESGSEGPIELPVNHGREKPYKPMLQGRQEAETGSGV